MRKRCITTTDTCPTPQARQRPATSRLRGAKALVAQSAVRIDGTLAWVGEGEHAYLVRIEGDARLSCTCLRWVKYCGGRG